MTSWNDYYDDFNQKIRQYSAKLPMTDKQYMAVAAEGLQDAQRRTNLITNVKTISGTDGVNYSLDTTDEGYDVLLITKLVDPYGAELVSQSVPQMQDTKELAARYYNEVPHNFARGKWGTTISDVEGYENRLYDHIDTKVRVYPALLTTDVLTLDYVVEIHKYTINSPQWAPFFTDFATAFSTAPPRTWQQLDNCWQFYALADYHAQIQSPLADYWNGKYERALQTAMDNKQQHFTNGATPYTTTPYGY